MSTSLSIFVTICRIGIDGYRARGRVSLGHPVVPGVPTINIFLHRSFVVGPTYRQHISCLCVAVQSTNQPLVCLKTQNLGDANDSL